LIEVGEQKPNFLDAIWLVGNGCS